jgi:tetratricopeptide (TPR) repeat protein
LKERIALADSLRRAELCFQQGQTHQAKQLLAKVLKFLPQHPQANSQLGVLLMQTGQPENAIRHFRIACEAQPKILFHWLRLLAAYQQTGNVEQAQQVLEQAATYQWSAQVMEQLAKVATEPAEDRQLGLVAMYQSGKDPLITEIAARFFVDDYPDHPLGWQILGALLHKSGKLEESLELVQKIVAKFPQDANAHNNLSHTLLALRRYEEALASARDALRLNPDLAQARAHESQALEGLVKKVC